MTLLKSKFLWLCLGCMGALAMFVLDLMIGAVPIDAGSVLRALFQPDGSSNQLVITTIRLPRAVIAVVIGASLAVSGALMQALSSCSVA
jgi:ABC-type Fe3+-siderophore transport system permease subunit